MTPDTKLSSRATIDNHTDPDHDPANKSDLLDDEEDFFDFITRSVVFLQSYNISDNVTSGSSLRGWMTRDVP